MTGGRADRVHSIFNSALNRRLDERSAFLEEACGSDAELRAEVTSLLQAYESAGSFLGSAAAAAAVSIAPRRLASGTRLGPYEVVAPIGAGGMGEVYRARDIRLDRSVAVKVLSSSLARDARSRERFEREAVVISKLTHPQICTLYDVGHHDGTDFLVMELLEGETLSARLARKPPPIDEALQYAIQIAEALAAAHAVGIVHRDLKPANVMLTKTGIKLLDFGLARLRGVAVPGGEAGQTIEGSLTSDGLIVGTLPYMAPEQVRGEEADARTDIFAFGVVLYEMLTGARPFGASSSAELIAAILERPPAPITVRLPALPAALGRLVETCLAKAPDDRWQTMRDVARELRWIALQPAEQGVRTSPVGETAGARSPRKAKLPWALAGAAVAALLLIALAFRPAAPDPRPPVRFSLTSEAGEITFPALSPDGRHLAYIAGSRAWLRSLDGLEERAVPGTDGYSVLSWIGDRWLAVGNERQGSSIQQSELTTVVTLDGTHVGTLRGRCGISARADGGLIVGGRGISFGTGIASPLVSIVPPDPLEHRCWPAFLPGGRTFLFWVWSGAPDRGGLYLGSVDPPGSRRVLPIYARAIYAPTGHLLYTLGNQLVAHLFDPRSAEFRGEPLMLVDDVEVDPASAYGHFAIADGALAYRTKVPPRGQYFQWRDRTGRAIGAIGTATDHYSAPAISRDGRRIALTRTTEGRQDIWIVEAARGVDARVTYGPDNLSHAAWSPDASRLIYSGSRTIHETAADGGGTATERPTFVQGRPTLPNDWSPDGRVVILQVPDTRWSSDLWLMPPGGEPQPLLATPFDEAQAAFSPDGRWFAYTSDESGVHEVYVQSYPLGRGKWRVSTNGGTQPRWRGDGRELFYVSGNGHLTAVAVASVESLDLGKPAPLFPLDLQRDEWGMRSRDYDVMPDGSRFLVRTLGPPPRSKLVVILNWPGLLARR